MSHLVNGSAIAQDRLRVGTIVVCLLLCAWEVTAYRRADPYNSDSSYYQGLAESLAAHRGYVFDFKPHTRYPPGLPVLLAGSGALVGRDYTAYVRLMPIFGLIGLLTTFVVIARHDRELVAATACVWLATSPQFFRTATQDVLSELPFFAVSAVALLAATAARPNVWLVAICTAAAVSIRSAGVALAAAFLATLITTWRTLPQPTRKAFGAAAAAGMAAELVWLAWTLTHAVPDWPGEPMDSYLRQLTLKDPHQPALGLATIGDLWWRTRDGVASLAAHFAELTTRVPWVAPLWFSPLAAIPVVLIVLGLGVSLARRQSPLLAWYVIAYCALFALWPFDEGVRFVLPVFPFLFMFAVRGLLFCLDTSREGGAANTILVTAFCAMGVGSLWSVFDNHASGFQAKAAVAAWFLLALLTSLRGRPGISLDSRFAHRHMTAVAASMASIGLAAGLFGQATIAAANRRAVAAPPTRQTVVSVASWLRTRPDTAAVMGQQTAVLHRLTGRRVVSLPTVEDGQLVARTIQRHDISYVVVAEPETDQYYRPNETDRFEAFADSAPGCCELAYANDGYRVYHVTHSDIAQVRSVLRSSR